MIHPIHRDEVDEHTLVVFHPVFTVEPVEVTSDDEVVVLNARTLHPAQFVTQTVMPIATGPRHLVMPIYRDLVRHSNAALDAIHASPTPSTSHPTGRIAA